MVCVQEAFEIFSFGIQRWTRLYSFYIHIYSRGTLKGYGEDEKKVNRREYIQEREEEEKK